MKGALMHDVLIGLAKAAILVALNQPEEFNLTQELHTYPQLEKKGAVFVTLTKGKEERLRGCIGSLEAWRPLYRDVIANAQAAALKDNRFPPLRKEELPQIKVEVSLLSKPQPLHYTDTEDLKQKIKPGIDGVILRYNNHRATYLPQVWEQLPEFETFFSSLCKKARLPADCLKLHPQIDVYHVTKYKEK
jgi:AmmeMemoRadiSam system protein A